MTVSRTNRRKTDHISRTKTHSIPFLDTIQCGNCVRLMRRIPDKAIDFVITSPPYFNQRDGVGNAVGGEYGVENYIDAMMDVLDECIRIVTDTGSIVFNMGDKYVDGNLLLVPYRFAIRATDTKNIFLVNDITWLKTNPTPRQYKRRLVSSTEPFFHFVKSPSYYYDQDAFMHGPKKTHTSTTSQLGKRYVELIKNSNLTKVQKTDALESLNEVVDDVRRGHITGFRMKIRGIHSLPFGGNAGGRLTQIKKRGFTIIRMNGNALKKDMIECPVENLKWNTHPAIYPVHLIQEMIKMLTPQNAIVLDPYMGSGSTAIAARLLGRHYIGMEINPEYCAAARERVDAT